MRRIGFGRTVLASLLALISVAASAQTMSGSAPAPAPAAAWPVKDGTYVIKDFRFGTGEVLPELKLHYLTLGTPHRDAGGACG